MNEILEHLYPDKTILTRRQTRPLPQLVPGLDLFSQYLHEEMRQCYLNGHDHAALVTACALIDSTVKDAIHVKAFVEANCEFDAREWDKIDALRFGQCINMAKSKGIVTKEEWEKLEWLRKHIRNVYMHGETPQWIKDKHDTIVRGNLETGETDEETVSVRDNIVLQRDIRIVADRNICNMVVLLVDDLAREFTARSIKRLEDWKKKNATKPTRHQVQRVLESMRKKGIDADFIIAADVPEDVPPPRNESMNIC